MSALNLNAPVFNYTKKHSNIENRSPPIARSYPKKLSLNPFHAIPEEEIVASQNSDYLTKLPSTNPFHIVAAPKEPICKEPMHPLIADEKEPLNAYNARELITKPVAAEEPIMNPFVGKQEGNEKEGNEQLAKPVNNKEILHPLHNYWTLWYLENDNSKTWEDMQHEITTIGNVEDFWNVYNNIKPPSGLSIGCDYSFFKRGIRPMWEDEANKAGGRWVITLNRTGDAELDNIWQNVLLCLIGEAFQYAHEICGAVVNIRHKTNKISVWTSDGGHRAAVLEIGTKLRDGLHLGRHSLQYQLHQDSMTSHGSKVRPVYVL